ncbi:hypothetical protein TTHERM_00216120 (macronuclear) [Tetrahymena thermophila SB210]|uniref:Uncharacterized protein n=1 Tax=Tetrahymena thermophila (strain SB210) TaxID=312017 RepID=I7M2E5_TETTS|nr:hypothetical protein TTHERM_00216120 [Tetrahymena thermophila SB210]EAS00237.2 hypothetical protein TTHERM_00216120 [Tetrahymena thermophila SB210]|eukprot:XP_001020482.2 hypothetical protein TTHERM_00216120 [Tetrahymena thermophila SB210]
MQQLKIKFQQQINYIQCKSIIKMEIEKQLIQQDQEHKFLNLPPNFDIYLDDCFFLNFNNENILPENIDSDVSSYKNIIINFTEKSNLLIDGLEKFIEKIVYKNRKIEYFELNLKKLGKWHKLDTSEVIRLCKIIQQVNKVKYLYLYFDSVSEEYSDDIICSIIDIAFVQTNLEMLHIELSSLAQKGAGQLGSIKLAQTIEAQNKLKHLSLNLHGWGTENDQQHPNQQDLLQIIQKIPINLNLESLYLCCGGWKSWGNIRDIDMQQYMNELKKLQNLKYLMLDLRGWACTISNPWETIFTNEGATYLQEFLSSQINLEWLNLKLLGWGDNNPSFTSQAIMSIGEGLGKLQNLQFLNLDLKKPPSSRDFQNKYSPYSLVYLLTQIRNLKKLTRVNIVLPNHCMIPQVKKVLQYITKAVQDRTHIIEVLKLMEKESVAQMYRKEIIQRAIIAIFGNQLKF